MSDQEHAEDIEDLAAEIRRRDTALRIAGENIVELNDKLAKVMEAFESAMLVIDQLLTDLRAANATPSPGLILAKGRLDIAMKRLKGG